MAIMTSPDRLGKSTPRRTFQLTSRRDYRPAKAKPSIQTSLERFLAMPRWDDAAVSRIERAIEHYWNLTIDWKSSTYRRGVQSDATEELIMAAESAIKEWQRIRDAKPLPTTAWLNRQSRIGSREDRAVAIYKRIRAATDDRIRQGEAKMRPFKTYKAQQNERRRVLGADPMLARLERYEALLVRYVPDVRNLASPKPWRYN